MARGEYEIWLSHWNGTRLTYLDSWLKIDYTRALHNVGVITIDLPSSFDDSLLQVDYKIEIWRALPGASKRLENVYLIRGWFRRTDPDGISYTRLIGVCGNDILKRRIVWAQPGSSQARKTDNACDLIKQYMREAIAQSVCYGATSGTERANVSAYFTVAPDDGLGASFTKNYEGKTLFDAANGIAETSTGRGTPIWWYVWPVSRAEYQLRTYLNLMGQDLTDQIIISPDFGMTEAQHDYDASEEATMVIGAGGKIGAGPYPDYRKMEYAYNNTRLMVTPFAWREKFLDVGSEPDYDAIIEACVEEVADPDNLEQEIFQCALQEMENLRYGREWDLGDEIGLNYRGMQMDAVIKTVRLTIEKSETVRVYFKIDKTRDIQTS